MYDEADSPVASCRSRANRVARACDRCRIRKIKCNGKSQCDRCSTDDAICIFTKKRRPNDRAYSKEYVQLLEEQRATLIKGIKELYRRYNAGDSLPELQDSNINDILIHDLLKTLGVLPKFQSEAVEGEYASTAEEDRSTTSPASDYCLNTSSSLTETQVPTLCTSPASSSSDLAMTSELPCELDFERMMNSLDNGQLRTLESLTASKLSDDLGQIWADPFQDPTASFGSTIPSYDFINPRDIGYMPPFHLVHAHTA